MLHKSVRSKGLCKMKKSKTKWAKCSNCSPKTENKKNNKFQLILDWSFCKGCNERNYSFYWECLNCGFKKQYKPRRKLKI